MSAGPADWRLVVLIILCIRPSVRPSGRAAVRCPRRRLRSITCAPNLLRQAPRTHDPAATDRRPALVVTWRLIESRYILNKRLHT